MAPARSAFRTARVRPASCLLVLAAALLLAVAGRPHAQGSVDPGLARLERELARLSRLSTGTVGLAATHLETNRAVVLNRGERFYQASVRKIPAALRLLSLVDEGKEWLDRQIVVDLTDLRPGSGTLSVLFDDPGVTLPLHTLMELMLLVSDNTATDLVMKAAGGPAAIQAHLQQLGVQGVRVDRYIQETQAAFAGLVLPPEPITLARFRALAAAVPADAQLRAQDAFARDPRDSATPEGLTALLVRLWRGELLSARSTALLLDTMRRAESDTRRLARFLPPGVVLRHKTGTMGQSTNDVGIIDLPDGGHVAISVLIKDATGPAEESEQVIGHLARAVYDYFRFRPGGDATEMALLEDELARIAPPARGTVGIAVRHLETGRRAYLNRRATFPMASTVKVAIAHRLLERVDRGELSLDTMIPLEAGDRHPGSGTLAELFDEPGVALSLRNYLELMLLISDNSATDVLLRQAGGAEAVTASLRALGIEGQRVDRSVLRLIADFVGVTSVPENESLSLERYGELARGVSDAERERRGERFDQDPRDTSTPEAMEQLLAAIWEGRALKPASRDLLIDIMRRCETGQARLKGLLPPDTIVAHKTGSIGRTTNDVGIIDLPDGAGRAIAVVFVKESRVDSPARERVIADAARAIHDFFLFSPQ